MDLYFVEMARHHPAGPAAIDATLIAQPFYNDAGNVTTVTDVAGGAVPVETIEEDSLGIWGENVFQLDAGTPAAWTGPVFAFTIKRCDVTPGNDAEVLAPFHLELINNFSPARALWIVRGSGTAAAPTFYALEYDASTDTARIVRCVAGVFTTIATQVGTGAQFTVGHAAITQKILCRFQVRGSELKARVWWTGVTEPAAWTVTVTDTTIATGVIRGIGVRNNGSTVRYVVSGWEFISIGVGATAIAKMPMTWDARRDELAESGYSGVVAARIGYLDSSGATGYACVATHPVITLPGDMPPNVAFDDIIEDVGEFTRSMSDQMNGELSSSFGTINLRNNNGRIDHWREFNVDGREFRMWVGMIGWEWHDFTMVARGMIVQIVTRSTTQLQVQLEDAMRILDLPVSLNTYASGTFVPDATVGTVKPWLRGHVFNIKPRLVNTSTHEYQVYDGALPDGHDIIDVRENGSSILGSATKNNPAGKFTLTASPSGDVTVDIGPEVEMWPQPTFDASTGLALGAGWSIATGKLTAAAAAIGTHTHNTAGPAIANDTTYGFEITVDSLTAGELWVLAGSGGDRYVITAAGTYRGYLTPGAASGFPAVDTIMYLYSGGAVALSCVVDRFHFFERTIGPNIATIAYDVAHEITALEDDQIDEAIAGGISGWSIYHALTSIDELVAGGIYIDSARTAKEVLLDLALSNGCFVGFTRHGRLMLGRFSLPMDPLLRSGPNYVLVEDDIIMRQLVPVQMIRPSLPEQLYTRKNWTPQTTIAGSVTEANRAAYQSQGFITEVYSPAMTGLSNPSQHALARKPAPRMTLLSAGSPSEARAGAVNEVVRLYTMYDTPVTIFEFKTRRFAFEPHIGSYVQLTHSRFGLEDGVIGQIVGIRDNYKSREMTIQWAVESSEVFPDSVDDLAGLMYTGRNPRNTTTDAKFSYWRILTTAYVFHADDVLRYEYWVDPGNPSTTYVGGMEIDLNGGLYARGIPITDRNGDNIARPTPDQSGTWIVRELSLSALAGMTSIGFNLVFEADPSGFYRSIYRNIRVTDATGATTRLAIWSAGPPTDNVVAYANAYTNQNAEAYETWPHLGVEDFYQ